MKTLVLLLASVVATFANTVSFDTLSPFTTVNTQYTVSDGVTFGSSNGTVSTWGFSSLYGSTVPNAICAASGTFDPFCTSELTLTFTNPVNGLSFFVGAINNPSAQTQVSVNGAPTFTLTGAPATTADYFSVSTPSNFSLISALTVSLTATNISTVTFYGSSDLAGVVYDDFRFTRDTNGGGETGVPEPGTLLLSGIGLLLLSYRKR